MAYVLACATSQKMQSEAIRRWTSWKQSTGPKTSEGKARAAQNANKGYDWKSIKRVAGALHRNEKSLADLIADYDSMADTVVEAELMD